MESQNFYGHGKLLLMGEYLVLDGAKALAIPCQYGQKFKATPLDSKLSRWVSYDSNQRIWLDIEFDLLNISKEREHSTDDLNSRLFEIFHETHQLNPSLFTQQYHFTTLLEFPRDWGLGTSSTLISTLAEWANVNPYLLLSKTFGGSGYDIACARSTSEIIYQKCDGNTKVETVKVPDFIKQHIYFVYLNQKQNSREAIANYRSTRPIQLQQFISKVNAITEAFLEVKTLSEAQELMIQHEALLSKVLKIAPIQSRIFSDFDGSIKSLGAWGGDFVMVLSKHNPSEYFKDKGYKTVLRYQDMALQQVL